MFFLDVQGLGWGWGCAVFRVEFWFSFILEVVNVSYLGKTQYVLILKTKKMMLFSMNDVLKTVSQHADACSYLIHNLTHEQK